MTDRPDMDAGEVAIRKAFDDAASANNGGPADSAAFNRRLADLPQNDLGNAQRLSDRYGANLAFVTEIGWLGWTGTHWSRADGAEIAQRAAQDTARAVEQEVDVLEADLGPKASEAEHKRVKGIRRWAMESGNSGRISAMQREAQTLLARKMEDFDRHPWLLNVQNGTLELKGPDGIRFREHRRSDQITKVAPVDYDRNANCPKFQGFVDRIIPDKGSRLFLQRYGGYLLTGDTSEQCFLLLYGSGSNGKTTLVEMLTQVLGDYAATLPFASLLQDDRRRGSEATPDLARLPGARLVISAETHIAAKLAEAIIKSLTGGEPIAARHLNKGFFEFRPQFKLILVSNHKLTIRGHDDGIWRRILLVPFLVQIPEHERNRHLKDELRGELPGILNWLLDGLRLYLERGLDVPEAVRAATQSYREDSDHVGRFLETKCRRLPGTVVLAKDLYEGYARWCRSNALEPMSQSAFGRAMTDRGFERTKVGVIHYRDLELVPEEGGGDRS